MNLPYSLPRSLFLLVILSVVVGSSLSAQTPINSVTSVRFLENRGQVVDGGKHQRPDILYSAQAGGVRMFLRKGGLSYQFVRIERPDGPPRVQPSRMLRDRNPDTSTIVTTYRMDVDLVGSNLDAVVEPSRANEDVVNFYLAHCPQGITGVRSFRMVRYKEIYPKIDLIYYGVDGKMKYDFIVHPGGRVSDIRMRYVGADSVRLADDGRVLVHNPLGEISEGRPAVWSESGAASQMKVASRYRVVGNEVTFDVGRFDGAKTLVIDPTLEWSTYYGGSGYEYGWGWGGWGWGWGGNGCRANNDTMITTVSTTMSLDFPVTPGVAQTSKAGPAFDYDLAIVRFTHRGNRVWATYLGGTQSDWSASIAMDDLRFSYIVGMTYSGDFPVTPGAFNPTRSGTYTGVFCSLSPTGTLAWSTYYNNTHLSAIAVDKARSVIVGGEGYNGVVATAGAFQTTPPAGAWSKGFLAKFTATGAQTWCTFYGGTPTAANPWYDGVSSITTDTANNIYACGTTPLSDFPIAGVPFQPGKNGPYDGWTAKLDANGFPIWSTYLGGNNTDYGSDIVVDRKGFVTVSGTTASTTFPVSPTAYQSTLKGGSGDEDAFLFRFDTAGARVWATYFGGTGFDYGSALEADGSGNLWLGVYEQSPDMPVTADAYKATMSGITDVGLAKFDTAGRLLYSTYFGGYNYDYLDGISSGPFGILICGTTGSPDLPMVGNSFQATLRGLYDMFLAFFCDPAPVIEQSGPTKFCMGDSVILSAPPGFDSYRWSTGATTRAITVKTTGLYSVDLTFGSCSTTSDPIPVTAFAIPQRRLRPVGPIIICEGDSATFTIGGGMKIYRWSTGDTTATIVVKAAGSYSVFFVDSNGCSNYSDTVVATISPLPRTTITASGPLNFCEGGSVTLDAGGGFAGYQWSNGKTSQTISVTKSGSYLVRVMNADGCWGPNTAVVNVKVFPTPVVDVRNLLPTIFCEGDSTVLVAKPSTFAKYEWSNGARTPSIAPTKEGTYTVTVTDTNGCTASAQMAVSVTPRPRPKLNVGGPTTFCEGDSVVLSVAGFVQTQWSNGSTSTSIVVKYPGKYFATVTNEKGCVGVSDTVLVEIRPLPNVAISGPRRVCPGTLATYTAPQGAHLGYAWTVGGTGAIASGAGTNTLGVQWGASGSGTVRLRVTNDSTGCSADTAFAVTVGSSLLPVISVDRALPMCAGDSVTLDAGDYASYRWSTGETTRRITTSAAGDYTVSVVDAKGCGGTSDTLRVRVNAPPAPVITMANGGVFCAGDSVVLDAGAGYARYLWTNGYTTRRIVVRTSGAYGVTVTDTNGCVGSSSSVTTRQVARPSAAISGARAVCRNSTVTYTTASVSGWTYAWSVTGGALTSGQGTPSVVVTWGAAGTGRVDLVATTSEGCGGASPGLDVVIGDRLEPVVTPSGPVVLCPGGTVELDAGDGYASYAWSSGETSRKISVQQGGVYSVTVSDGAGCSGTSSGVVVEEKAAPVPLLSALGVTEFCDGDSVALEAGDGYASYAWSTGETTQRIIVKQSGAYSVTVVDADGCTGTSTPQTVTVHPLPVKPVVTLTGSTLSTGSYAGYQWLLNGTDIAGAVSVTHTADASGEYRVRVTDGYGCSAESEGVYYREGASSRGVWLDTISTRVGERARLVVHVDPALSASDSVHGYHVELSYDAKALFVHDVISPDRGATGDAARYAVLPGGRLVVDRALGSPVLVGGELFAVEVEGLVTGQPLNVVEAPGVTMAEVQGVRVVGSGLVILSGCDLSASFGRRVQVSGLRPNPAREGLVVRYRLPAGKVGELRLLDALGRTVKVVSTLAGTGAEEELVVGLTGVASGVYLVELRDGGERSGVPIVIEK